MTALSTDAAAPSGPDLGRQAGQLLMLSGPIILSQLAQTASGVVDVVMAGQMGPVALGAVSTGAALWIPMMIFLLGLMYGMTPLIGNLIGSGKTDAVAAVAARGIAIGLLGGVILGAFLYFAGAALFPAIGVSADLIPDAEAYVQWVALGLPGMGLFVAFRFVIEAHGAPMLVTVTTVLGVIAKVFLNLALVTGAYGAPELGTPGFGVATVIVFWGMGLTLMAFALLHGKVRRAWAGPLTAAAFAPREIGRYFAFALPIAFNFLSDYVVMGVIAVFIATISAVAISAHQISFNVIMVLLMAPLGISMAATILISRAAAQADRRPLRQVIRLTLGLTFALALVMTALLAVFADDIARIYTQDAAVLALAGTLLFVITIILAVDVVMITLGFILRGLGDPTGPFLIMLGVQWLISIPLGYVLAFTDWVMSPQGVVGWWYGLSVGLVVACVLMALRLRVVMARKRPA